MCPLATARLALRVFLAFVLTLLAVVACSGAAPGDGPTASPDSNAVGQVPASPLPTATRPASLTPPATATLPPANTPSPVLPVSDGEQAPDFQFTLFQGQDVLGAPSLRLSELKGKPLVLNFWARFCQPCWSEMPELQDFYDEYVGRVQLLGVDIGQFTGLGSPKDASRLLDALGITYPAGSTDDGSVVRKYGVQAMPTTVFITAGGEVFRRWTGSINREQLEAMVAGLLEEG